MQKEKAALILQRGLCCKLEKAITGLRSAWTL
jgi:hypothetical protein